MSIAFVIIGTVACGFIEVIPIVSSPFTTKPEDIGLSVGSLGAIRGSAGAIATAIYLSILNNKDTTLSAEKIPVAVLDAGLFSILPTGTLRSHCVWKTRCIL
jgi:hypothetical protein